MWAAWLALWMLIIPVQIWNRNLRSNSVAQFVAQHPKECVTILAPALGVMAALVAVAVFFHLFKSNSANFVGALPMRREGVFFTAFAAGYTMLLGPLAVMTLATLLLEGLLGYFSPTIFMFLGAAALNSFFWLSFAALCCVISGHGVAAVAFYFIFNWIVPVMTNLVEGLLSGFLYGFVGFGEEFYEVSNWLCPVLQLTQHTWHNTWGFDDWNMLAIYAAVGFLMFLCALGLHHIRKAERAGDLIAFDPIKWLFKICVTVCGGMGLGTFLTIIIFDSMQLDDLNGWKFAVCCAVAAFLCYMVAEMLLAKSFKVWKHWKGAVVSAVCFILVVAAVDMDWIGFTTRVPDPGQVKSVTAYFDGTEMGSVDSNGLTFTGEDVKAVTDLHQYLVDHREDNYRAEPNYLTLRISYKLGWTTLQRRYTCWYSRGDQLSQALDLARGKGQVTFPSHLGLPTDLSFDLDVSGLTGVEGNASSVTIDAKTDEVIDTVEYISHEIKLSDIEAIWAAVTEDIAGGRYRPVPTATEAPAGIRGTMWARWYGEYEREYFDLRLSPALTSTWKALKDRGYLDALPG